MTGIHCIQAADVNGAFVDGIHYLRAAGVEEQSRNGPVLVAPSPVMTVYKNPRNRVLFNPRRDANPVFHLMEAIWMMAGRDDVAYLLPFNSKFDQYAEEDGRVHGAYGARWKAQLATLVRVLRSDPNTRQAVLQMWDYTRDLGAKKRDIPCNTQIYFDRRGGVLNMTVTCRSNDMLWGAYGANAVHMSFLQEVIATDLGIPVGVYRQFSNNFHLYTDLPMVQGFLSNPPMDEASPYQLGHVVPEPIDIPLGGVSEFCEECRLFCAGYKTGNTFLNKVAAPMRDAYLLRKDDSPHWRVALAHFIPGNDWHEATRQWFKRRGEDV